MKPGWRTTEIYVLSRRKVIAQYEIPRASRPVHRATTQVPAMRVDLVDILGPPVLGVAFLFLSWSQMRMTRGRDGLTSYDKKLLTYGFLFVVGLGYLVLLARELHWPDSLMYVAIGAWGVLLAFIAWRRYQRERAASKAPQSTKQVADYLKEGLPVVGLLVCLIGSAIEWESVAKGQGRLIVALLWTGGVALVIWLARRNRRATVVTALRAFLGLLVIGAIAQQSLAAVVAAAVVGGALLLLQKLWKQKSDGVEAPESLFPKPGAPPSTHNPR